MDNVHQPYPHHVTVFLEGGRADPGSAEPLRLQTVHRTAPGPDHGPQKRGWTLVSSHAHIQSTSFYRQRKKSARSKGLLKKKRTAHLCFLGHFKD